jgi:hypothetical protein
MPVMDVTCMETILRNPTASPKKYLFLPKNQEFDASEEKTFFGDITSLILQMSDDAETGRRRLGAFKTALEAGDIEVVKTPNPLLQDTVTDATKLVKLTSGSLGTADPCFADSV